MQIVFRRAQLADLPAIVALLADDALGQQREDARSPTNPKYVDAFRAILADANQLQMVATANDEVIGTLQLSFIPGLARKGAWRGQIEFGENRCGTPGIRCWAADVRMGDRPMPSQRLRSRPAHDRQDALRCSPLLREAGIRWQSLGLQADALASSRLTRWANQRSLASANVGRLGRISTASPLPLDLSPVANGCGDLQPTDYLSPNAPGRTPVLRR